MAMVLTNTRHFKTLNYIYMGFFDFMNEDIAIDLGTANTLIIHNDKVVVDEPSIVAIETRTGKVIVVEQKLSKCMEKLIKE